MLNPHHCGILHLLRSGTKKCLDLLPRGLRYYQLDSKYTQGYSPKRGVREYFYYIDHQGQVCNYGICIWFLYFMTLSELLYFVNWGTWT